MAGLSTLATLLSVLSFPLIFMALIYPHLMGSRGRWNGVILYGAISIGMMLIAVITSPEPHEASQDWTWLDWLVIALGTGCLLAFIGKKYSSLKKLVLEKRQLENNTQGRGKGNTNSRKKKSRQ